MARPVSPRTLSKFLKKFAELHGASPASLLPQSDVGRRYYEVRVLIWLFEELRGHNYRPELVNGTKATLRWSGNYLNRKYSYFVLHGSNGIVGEVWTDVWILSRKAHARACVAGARFPRPADYRELDILVLKPGAQHGRPVCHRLLMLGIECKTSKRYEKHLWGEILGMRHFVSRDWKTLPTRIRWKPRSLPYKPPSILIAAGLPRAGLTSYSQSMQDFGIQAEIISYRFSKRR